MAPDVTARYQRAGELLADLLRLRSRSRARRTARAQRPAGRDARPGDAAGTSASIPSWERDTPQPRFCWHCHKPLHARSDRCPFCGEAQ